MFLKPRNLEEACWWVIVNNVSVAGKNPQRFRQKIKNKTGQQLIVVIEQLILNPKTQQHQVNSIQAHPNWWTIEDLIIHNHRTRWLSDPAAQQQAKKNYECYQRIRKNLPC